MIRRVLGVFAVAAVGAAMPGEAREQEHPSTTAGKDARPELTEEIVVTGSRVKRKDLTTPAPVVVIDREQILNSGYVSVGEILQAIPEQANAMNRNWNNGGDGSTRVNLRGLGSYRTLVLLNGRRLGAGGVGADMSTDLSTLPSAAVERIEVLKDGASPIYGSDAMGGVVNIITRRSWSGAEAAAYSGLSSRGDGATYTASLTTGRRSEGGNLLFTAGYARQDAVWAADRGWSQYYWNLDATGANSPLLQRGPFAVGDGNTPGGRVFLPGPSDASGPGSALYDQLATTYPNAQGFVPDPSSPSGWRPWRGDALPQYGGDQYNFEPANYLVTPARNVSLFTTGDARVLGTTRAFFEAAYGERASSQKLAPEPFFSALDGIVVSAQNEYNPFGVDLYDVQRRLMEAGNRTFTENVESLRVLGGLDGTLPDGFGPLRDWSWEVSAGQSRTRATFVRAGYTRISAMRDALGPTFRDGQGVLRCGTAASGPIPGCVPLNLFGGPGSIPPEQVTALTFDGTSRGTNTTSAVLASASGGLFTLFADRPVGLALGYEYRRVAGEIVPDPVSAAGDASTEGEFVRTEGSQDSHEVYGELSIPILSGVILAENAEALAAARVFRYSGFGTDWTWKLGARWTPIRDVTLRGTWSTAFRAPAIGELYAGKTWGTGHPRDPCGGGVDASGMPVPVSPWCGDAANNGHPRPFIPVESHGNPDLRPEVARVITAGIVLQPRFLANLSLTVDLYDVQIENTIHAPTGAGVAIKACYPMSPDVQPSLCDYVQRDPTTYELTRVLILPINLGTERMRGVDVAMRYVLPTPAGRFGLSLDATWLDRYDITRADGSVLHVKGTYDYPDIGALFPSWKYNAGVTWGYRGIATGLGFRYIGSFVECADVTGLFPGSLCSFDASYVRRVRASELWDAFAGYTFETRAGKTSVSVGVQNILDAAPPRIYNSWLPSDPGYDFMGRFYYARLSHRM